MEGPQPFFGWGLFIPVGDDAVVVHGDLFEDLSKSLSELNDVLSVNLHQKDPVFRAIVRDAQIFSFVRTSEVLRNLIGDIHSENAGEQLPEDLESAVITLCMLDIIDEDQAHALMNQLDLAEFLALDRSWLESDEDRRLFDGGIHEIVGYHQSMSSLLHKVSSHCTFIEYEENDDHGH